jgi:hypothetical protein
MWTLWCNAEVASTATGRSLLPLLLLINTADSCFLQTRCAIRKPFRQLAVQPDVKPHPTGNLNLALKALAQVTKAGASEACLVIAWVDG